MSYYRINGTNGFIEFKDGVLTIRRQDNNTFGRDDSRVVIDSDTYPLAKLPRGKNAYFSIFEEKPARGQFASYDPKKDKNSIQIPAGLSDEEVIAFMQAIWEHAEKLNAGKSPVESSVKDTEAPVRKEEPEEVTVNDVPILYSELDEAPVTVSEPAQPLSLKRVFPKSMPPMPTFAPKSSPEKEHTLSYVEEKPQPVAKKHPLVTELSETKTAVNNTAKGSQWFLDLSSETVKDYVVVDIETTGLDTIDDRIIELGAVRYIDDVEVGRFSSLVRPYTPKLMAEYTFAEFEELAGTSGINYIEDPYVSELTGITNAMLADAPTADQIAPAFFDFVGNLPLVGHNILKFDLEFLRNFADDTKSITSIGHDVIDTIKMAEVFAQDAGSRSLAKVKNHFGGNAEEGHRALDDALSTAFIYQEMKKLATDAQLRGFRVYNTFHLSHLTISPNPTQLVDNPDFAGKVFVLTGEMRMYRGVAMQHIVNHGGKLAQSITKNTSFLLVSDDTASNTGSKLRKLYQQKQGGQDISLMNETSFYHEIDVNPPEKDRVSIVDASALDYA